MFRIIIGGVSTGSTWNTTGIVAGAEYLVEIEYNPVSVTLKIDGVLKSTQTPGTGIDFGANILDTFYAGTRDGGSGQNDAVFSAP